MPASGAAAKSLTPRLLAVAHSFTSALAPPLSIPGAWEKSTSRDLDPRPALFEIIAADVGYPEARPFAALIPEGLFQVINDAVHIVQGNARLAHAPSS